MGYIDADPKLTIAAAAAEALATRTVGALVKIGSDGKPADASATDTQLATMLASGELDVDAISLTFDALGVGTANYAYVSLAIAPNGTTYVAIPNVNVYRVSGTSLVALGAGARNWCDVKVSTTGKVYAAVTGGKIYSLNSGTGAWDVEDSNDRDWKCLGRGISGAMYAGVWSGDVYKQAGGSGSGNFTACSAGTHLWICLAVTATGDVLAWEYTGDLYIQAAGSGAFAAQSLVGRSWYGADVNAAGDVIVVVNNGGIYRRAHGTSTFELYYNVSKEWRGIAYHPTTGAIQSAQQNGDIWQMNGPLPPSSMYVYRTYTGGVAKADATARANASNIVGVGNGTSLLSLHGFRVMKFASQPVLGSCYLSETGGVATQAPTYNKTLPRYLGEVVQVLTSTTAIVDCNSSVNAPSSYQIANYTIPETGISSYAMANVAAKFGFEIEVLWKGAADSQLSIGGSVAATGTMRVQQAGTGTVTEDNDSFVSGGSAKATYYTRSKITVGPRMGALSLVTFKSFSEQSGWNTANFITGGGTIPTDFTTLTLYFSTSATAGQIIASVIDPAGVG